MTTPAAAPAAQAPAAPAAAPAPAAPAAAAPPAAPAAPAAAPPAGGDPSPGPAAAAPAAAEPPVTYVLTVPDDAKGMVSTEQLDYLKEVAKASKWSQEDAQAELNEFVKREQSRLTARAAAWANETKSDPEIGGDKLATSQRHISAVLDRFAPASEPDGALLRTALTAEGYESYRPLAKFLARIGKAMAEDSPGQLGLAGSGARKSDAEVMFGDVVAANKEG